MLPFLYILYNSSNSYAGGEITDEIIKSCENGTQAESCRLLAEESKCGVGFNSDTAMYLGMACEINKNKCKDKSTVDCFGYGQCLVGCIGGDSLDVGNILDSYPEESGCWLGITSETEEQKIQSALDVLQGACSKKNHQSCLLAGEVAFELYKQDTKKQSNMLKTAIQFFQQGCELNDINNCAQLTIAYEEAAKTSLQKTCSLKQEQRSEKFRREPYKSMCPENSK